jgi:hypothetical protein
MKEITIQGSFFEMGQQYGTHFKSEIKKMVFEVRLMAVASEGEGRDFFRPKIRHMVGGLLKMKKYRTKYKEVATEFETNIEKYYPEILEMIKGISDSTKVDYKDIIFVNCLLEYSLKCSAFGATGNSTKEGKPLIAMNADEAKAIQKYYVTINLKPKNAYSFTAVYIAGLVFPVFGMNEHGLALASLVLFLDNDSLTKIRMPFFLKLSVIHNCKTVNEAMQIFDNIPPSGMGAVVYVADSNQLLAHEESSILKKTFVYDNGTHHTANFPLSEELQEYVKVDKLDDIAFFYAKNRHRRIGDFLKKNEGQLDEELFHQIISDHGSPEDDSINKSVCVHPENTKGIKTCASIILSPRDKTMKIFDGNPCKNVGKSYEFK